MMDPRNSSASAGLMSRLKKTRVANLADLSFGEERTTRGGLIHATYTQPSASDPRPIPHTRHDPLSRVRAPTPYRLHQLPHGHDPRRRHPADPHHQTLSPSQLSPLPPSLQAR